MEEIGVLEWFPQNNNWQSCIDCTNHKIRTCISWTSNDHRWYALITFTDVNKTTIYVVRASLSVLMTYDNAIVSSVWSGSEVGVLCIVGLDYISRLIGWLIVYNQ